MSGISSVGSSTSSTYYSPLDTNKDGVVDAQELQAAAKSGLLAAGVSNDENSSDSSDSTDSGATNKFSGNLVDMLLQQMEQQSSTSGSTSTSGTSASTSSGSTSQSNIDSLFTSLDTNGDGQVSASEFVAGRPKSMSEKDASALFKSLDTQDSGSLSKDQFSAGVNALTDQSSSSTSATSAASTTSSSPTAQEDALQTFLNEMQASLSAYENTYGQYNFDTTSSASTAVAA